MCVRTYVCIKHQPIPVDGGVVVVVVAVVVAVVVGSVGGQG